MPLHANSSRSSTLEEERRRDHYSHFILRLAFSGTEDLRRRYSRLETMLFRLRFRDDDSRERQAFIDSLNFDWERVTEEERRELGADLTAASGFIKRDEEQGWFKLEWEKVPDLVEQRKVLLRRGYAYVPIREQASLVVSEFTRKLDQALEVRVQVDKIWDSVTDLTKANGTRPSSSRRRRPTLTHPRPPLQSVHRSRHCVHIDRCATRQHPPQRVQYRRSRTALSPMHVSSSH